MCLKMRYAIFTVVFCLMQTFGVVQSSWGQTATLNNLPSNTANTRFYDDTFKNDIVRPALSVRGFDSSGLPGGSNYGYGLKQILDKVYNNPDSKITIVYNEIISNATNNDLITPIEAKEDIEFNSRLLQDRAFVALVTYVLKKNGNDLSTLDTDLPSHDEALNLLKKGFTQSPYKDNLFVTQSINDDLVKWVKTQDNISRAIDLYLALENAYYYYGGADRTEYNDPNSNTLLSKSQKGALLSKFSDRMATLDDLIHENLRDLPSWMFYVFPGLSQLIQYTVFESVSYDEIEPGNRPLKIETSLAYASLGSQDISSDYPSYSGLFDSGLLENGFESVADRATQARKRYWSYQSNNGKEFWAEGPFYLHYALRQVIPFWHAIRGNGMLNFGGRNLSDPFSSSNSMLLGPLNWLADLTTSQGEMPSLDDGNKVPIKRSSILRWSSVYGNTRVGQKYAWINERSFVGGPGSANNLTLVELAIPRTGFELAPPDIVGNQSPSQTGENGDQQIVVRYNDGTSRDHHLVLNGESGDAIIRGEGHEQSDQLQLTYSSDGISYLVDTGYNNAAGTQNSTWNGYGNHNVMMFDWMTSVSGDNIVGQTGAGSGLPSPYIPKSGPAPTKARMVSDHNSVSDFYRETDGNIVQLHGEVDLATTIDSDSKASTYQRDVLFVKDNSNPYIIDFNSMTHREGNNIYRMRYTGNSDQLDAHYADGSWQADGNSSSYQVDPSDHNPNYPWDVWRISTDNDVPYSDQVNNIQDMYLFFQPVEFEKMTYEPFEESFDIEEVDNDPLDVQALILSNYGSGGQTGSGKPYYNTMGIITLSASKPSFSPQKIFSYQSDGETPHQAWYWKQDANTVDVIVRRSRVDMTRYDQKIDFRINENGISTNTLRLPGGKDYGFARLHKVNGQWVIDSDYQINLEMLPLSVSIQGPRYLSSYESGTWTANLRNAKGSVSYQWYRRETPEDSWRETGTSGSYSGYFRNRGPSLKSSSVKVEVASAGETAANTFLIIVSPSSDDCNSLTVSSDGVGTNRIPPICKSVAESKAIPEKFGVESNYPNPFNPSTTIKFGLPEQADVTLNVYNILGQRVAALVNETKAAGYYEVRFDASNLASGFYIGRLTAKGESGKPFVKELKMQLVK